MRAPLTFGASTAGTLNLVPSGCDFSRYRQLTLMAFGPASPANSSVRRLNRNSSSCDACADNRKRTPSAFDVPAGGGQAIADLRGRVVPGHRLLKARGVLLERLPHAIVAFDPVVLEAADVAHPVVVDVGVQPRREPNELRALRPLRLRLDPRGDVAALRALRADQVGGERVVPRTRLEPVVARGDRADRTHVHQVARDERVHAFFLERRDLAAVPAVEDVDLRVVVDVAHEAHAPRAENAAVAVEHERRTEVDVRLHAVAVELAPRELHPALIGTEGVRKILQRALAALVAHRAIERVIDQQKLEDAGARAHHVRRARRHHHAFGAHGRTRRLQLRHLLDLDDADAAGAVDADARVIAVIRDGDAAFDGGLQDGLAFLDGDPAAVDRERHGFHKQSIISSTRVRLTTSAATPRVGPFPACCYPVRRS